MANLPQIWQVVIRIKIWKRGFDKGNSNDPNLPAGFLGNVNPDIVLIGYLLSKTLRLQ
jgi:hypothetical protein